MGRASPSQLILLWAAQAGPQQAFLRCPATEVVYGGARGGGKTDACLGEWLVHSAKHGAAAKGIFLRRELPQLEAAIARAKELYLPIGAVWKEQAKTFLMPGGGVLKFRPLERDADAAKYQGHDYTRVYAEELTNWPSPGPILKMIATLRSAAGVRCQLRATCNPGGVGHAWVKARYIANGPYRLVRDGLTSRVFIPARLSDNPALTRADPGYVDRLKQTGSAQQVRAWLDGDWDVVEGAYFTEWDAAKHIVAPFEISNEWTRFRSFDWGFARPFSVGWWAVAGEDVYRPEGVIPRGALVRYREWYGAGGPNAGLRLTTEEVARGIKEREAGERINYGVADPAIFSEDGGPSRAEIMRRLGVGWRPADNARVGRNGAMGGWDEVRARLRGKDGRPTLYVFSTCEAVIRTLPALQHDADRPEDVDTDGEDHAADELRYACMSRPIARKIERPAEPQFPVNAAPTTVATLNELWERASTRAERI